MLKKKRTPNNTKINCHFDSLTINTRISNKIFTIAQKMKRLCVNLCVNYVWDLNVKTIQH